MKKKFLRGFTLIELLVVITIIGILAGLAIPVISAALQAAKKTEAKVFMSSLANAVVNYQTEYNVYPAFMTTISSTNAVLTTSDHWKDYYTAIVVPAGQTNAKATFLATNNPREISFLSVQSKYLDNTTDPTSATYFNDPWGHLYTMWVDTDYDNVLNSVTNIPVGSGTISVPGTVLVWSSATDQTNSINVKKSIGTWK